MTRILSEKRSQLHSASLLLALLCALAPTTSAVAQMCSLDAGCDDAGEPLDASMMSPMDGSIPDDEEDGGFTDAGQSSDGGLADAGTFDAGDGGESSTAACSCEAARSDDGFIHVCTGSFDRATCRTFSCELGTLRSERCSNADVGLCCTMKAKRLYSQLYGDCDHPNCESGFRAQCADFGGTVSEGACDSPELPDDPDTTIGEDFCTVSAPGHSRGAWLKWLWLLAVSTLHARRTARRR